MLIIVLLCLILLKVVLLLTITPLYRRLKSYWDDASDLLKIFVIVVLLIHIFYIIFAVSLPIRYVLICDSGPSVFQILIDPISIIRGGESMVNKLAFTKGSREYLWYAAFMSYKVIMYFSSWFLVGLDIDILIYFSLFNFIKESTSSKFSRKFFDMVHKSTTSGLISMVMFMLIIIFILVVYKFICICMWSIPTIPDNDKGFGYEYFILNFYRYYKLASMHLWMLNVQTLWCVNVVAFARCMERLCRLLIGMHLVLFNVGSVLLVSSLLLYILHFVLRFLGIYFLLDFIFKYLYIYRCFNYIFIKFYSVYKFISRCRDCLFQINYFFFNRFSINKFALLLLSLIIISFIIPWFVYLFYLLESYKYTDKWFFTCTSWDDIQKFYWEDCKKYERTIGVKVFEVYTFGKLMIMFVNWLISQSYLIILLLIFLILVIIFTRYSKGKGYWVFSSEIGRFIISKIFIRLFAWLFIITALPVIISWTTYYLENYGIYMSGFYTPGFFGVFANFVGESLRSYKYHFNAHFVENKYAYFHVWIFELGLYSTAFFDLWYKLLFCCVLLGLYCFLPEYCIKVTVKLFKKFKLTIRKNPLEGLMCLLLVLLIWSCCISVFTGLIYFLGG